MRGPALHVGTGRSAWRTRHDWVEPLASILVAVLVGILVSELLLNPTRRIIMFCVGLVFAAGVTAVPTGASLALLVFLLPFGVSNVAGSSNMIFILLLAVLVAWRRFRAEERLFVHTPVALPMLLLFGMHLVSFYNVQPADRGLALQKVFGLGTAMLLFVILVTVVRDARTLRTVLIASLLGCAATCVVAGYEITHPGHTVLPRFFYAPWSAREGLVRAVATFGNYSNYAQYLGMHMLIAAYLLLRTRSAVGRGALVVLLASASAVFINTGMRGAFMALLVASAYIAVFGRRALPWRETGVVAVVLAGVLGLGAVFMTSVLKVWTVFKRFGELGLVGGSIESRREIMARLFAQARLHPIIGHGPVIHVPESLNRVLSSNNPHNQYLYYFYTVGLLGLLAFLWFAARLAVEGHRTLVTTRRGDPFTFGLLAVLQGNMVLFLLHEMADDYMYSGTSIHVTWFLFGVLMATIRVVQRGSEETAAG